MPPVEREWLESALAPLGDAVLVIGPGRRVLWCNEATRELLGWEPAELVGRTTELLHEDEEAYRRFGEAGDPTLLREGIFHVRWRLRRRDGELIDTSHTVVLLEPAGGLAAGALSIVRDLSQARAKADRWLAARHAGEALDLAEAAHAVHDERGFVSVNEAAAALLGQSEAALRGRHLVELLAEPERERLRAELKRAIAEGGTFGPFDVQPRDGGWTRPSLRVFGLGLTGGAAGRRIVLLFEGLAPPEVAASARERSLRFFRTLVDSSLDVVTVLDREGRIVFENPAGQEVLGHRLDDRLGRSAFDWAHPDDRGEVERLFRERLPISDAREQARVRLRHADGGWRTCDLVARNLLHDGRVEGVVVSSRDVTDRVESERRLKAATERLLQVEKMEAVGRLAGGVAHDFNNVLTAIHSYAELLRPAVEGHATAQDDLEEILSAAGRARELVRRLLDIGQRARPRRERVRLGQLLEELEGLLRRLVGDGVRLALVVDEPGACVLADPSQLERVIVNLAVNARDAMPEGGCLEIGVDLEEEQREEGTAIWVRLRVSDEGVGIDENTLGRIFEPFFTTKGEKGTGLGLATVWALVQQSEGVIEVESEPGRGTTFTIWWPAAADQSRRPSAPIE